MSRDAWLSFVPAHTAADLAAHPDTSPIGREQRFEAVALFADVSGFTAISEALARAGRSGTEELTTILNSYFEPMIALIESYGGIVGKFGGDAMTVIFPIAEDSAREVVIRRATACALAMQADMGRYRDMATSAGPFTLAMKAGLAAGPAYCTSIGDPATRLEFIIAGPAIDGCSDAEHHAEKGEVVVQDALLPALPELTRVEAREGFTVVAGALEGVERAPLIRPELPPNAYAPLERYLPPTVAARLAAGRDEFIDEHRRVTVIFAAFAEFDYVADPQIAERLQGYLGEVVRIVNRYDGTLNKIDMGDKGSKFIVLFGAPVSHEDDERRALRCALDLSAIPGDPPRLGVNTGLVYAGRVGSSLRREYTVMGDAVNLAARLMQFARPGQVIVGETTYSEAGVEADFAWEALEPITVKGKRDPLQVYRLDGLRARAMGGLRVPAYALPMVGRAEELATIEEKMALAARGEGQIVGIVGEAGLGKSRLVAEAVKRAAAMGFSAQGGACQSFNTDLGFVVWNEVWRGLFGLDATQPAERQIAALEAALDAIDPDLRPRLPLVGPLVGLAIRDNPFTEMLDPTARAELLGALLLTCLRRLTAPGRPLLIVLEDLHWIDPQSRALLQYLGRNLARLPVVLILAYRPPVDEHIDREFAFMLPALRFAHFTELRLGRFSLAEAEALIALKLAQHFDAPGGLLSPDFVARLVERVEGNPFYIDELMNLLRDQGLDPRDADALESLALPDSLQSLILARIDRLSEAEQIILKVASVIGRSFRASWIPGAYPQAGASPEVFQRLGRLSDLELTPLDRPDPELEYLFKHITTQEVAYDSMAFATRETLHARVGGFIEARYADALDDYLHLLAFHYGRTPDQAKQRVYFRRAGDAAKAGYLHQAAVRYYEALLPLLADDPAAQIEVQIEIGAAHQVAGAWPEAESALRRALTLADHHGDALRAARAQVALGDLLSYTERFEEALDLLRAAHVTFERLEDGAGLARALRHLSYLAFRQSDFDEARQYAEAQIALADAEADPVVGARAVADARHNLGLIGWYTGDLAGAEAHFNAAVEAAGRADHKQAVIYALNNLSGLRFTTGDYAGAMRSAREVLELASEIGYTRVMGLALGNLGSAYQESGGHDDDALVCYEASLRLAVEIGDAMSASYTLHNLALLLLRRGEIGLSGGLLDRAERLARAQHNDDLLADCAYTRARLAILDGRAEAALYALDDALHLSEAAGRDDVNTEARALARRLRAEPLDALRADLRATLRPSPTPDAPALPAAPGLALRDRLPLPALLALFDGALPLSSS